MRQKRVFITNRFICTSSLKYCLQVLSRRETSKTIFTSSGGLNNRNVFWEKELVLPQRYYIQRWLLPFCTLIAFHLISSPEKITQMTGANYNSSLLNSFKSPVQIWVQGPLFCSYLCTKYIK